MILYRLQANEYAPGAALYALVVICSLLGLTLHEDFYAGIRRRDYFAYYTNQSNLLVFLYFALIAPVLYSSAALRALIPHAEYAVTLCILLTHLVFHHFLLPRMKKTPTLLELVEKNPISHWDSVVQHYILPWLTLCYWLLFSPEKESLRLFDAFLWLCFPLSYLAYVFYRARKKGIIRRTRSAYPYPFLDAAYYGRESVLGACALLLLFCVLIALCGLLLAKIAVFLS